MSCNVYHICFFSMPNVCLSPFIISNVVFFYIYMKENDIIYIHVYIYICS